jgi:ABC-2 type transport system permease protein
MQNIKNKYWLILLIIGFIASYIVVSKIHYKIDLTKEKRFSISPASVALLQQLNAPVYVQVLLTGNLSAGFKKLNLATEELLTNLRNESNGKLEFVFKKPGEGLQDSAKAMYLDSLVRLGIKPFNNQLNRNEDEKTEQIIFPGAVITYKNKQTAIDLMSGKSGADEESSLNYSEALLEFKFDDAIEKLTRKTIPTVAYALGNGEPFNPTVNDIFSTLSNQYKFGTLDIKKYPLNPLAINALLIVKPSIAFTENDKIKIDQYILHGGKVVWCIDKLFAEFDSLLRSKSDFIAFDKNLDIDDILFKYGVRINGNLLQDLNCAKQPLIVGESGGKPQLERVPFPYYPLLTSPNNNPISVNLDQILSVFPSSIDTVKAAGITKTILLSSDTNSRIISTPNLVSLQSIQNENDLKTFTKSFVPVCVLLDGKFNSAFTNRFTPAMKDTVANQTGLSFIEKATTTTQQIVMADADLVTNVFSPSKGPLPMGVQQFENYQFANKEFFLNCIEYLVGNRDIIATRNKSFTLRLLDKNKIKDEKTFWQLINILLPLLIILIFAIVQQTLRSKKFAK